MIIFQLHVPQLNIPTKAQLSSPLRHPKSRRYLSVGYNVVTHVVHGLSRFMAKLSNAEAS